MAIWKLLMIAEQTFHKLSPPHMLPHVMAGAKFADGWLVDQSDEEDADGQMAA
ncbi:MAG TPA: hypothetical protein VGS41_16545 [Chthonomonadales bacterium]|nr:hypothetical protein [Chthonomonadales bacterium]